MISCCMFYCVQWPSVLTLASLVLVENAIPNIAVTVTVPKARSTAAATVFKVITRY